MLNISNIDYTILRFHLPLNIQVECFHQLLSLCPNKYNDIILNIMFIINVKIQESFLEGLLLQKTKST